MATSIEEIKQAIKANNGLIAPAARNLGISRQALHKRINKNKGLRALVKSERETLKDFAESILFKLIKQENFNAVKYFLSTQAKDRGYFEKLQTEDLTEDKKQIIKIGNQIIEF